jgi:hypothetical protein
VLVRDGPNCDIVVDTGTALYKNTIVGGEKEDVCVHVDIDYQVLLLIKSNLMLSTTSF